MVFDLTISILKLCRYYFINFKRNLSHKIHRFFQKYKMICFIIKNYFYWKKHFLFLFLVILLFLHYLFIAFLGLLNCLLLYVCFYWGERVCHIGRRRYFFCFSMGEWLWYMSCWMFQNWSRYFCVLRKIFFPCGKCHCISRLKLSLSNLIIFCYVLWFWVLGGF